MLHNHIPIQVKGSCPDTKLTTYFIDASEEMNYKRKRPLVFICPGGAYRFTSDREAELVALQFNSIGFHAAVLRYSCVPAVFPTALLEVAKGVRLCRENAEKWKIDEDKIFVMGFSAGGHLAASYAVFWNRDFITGPSGCDAKLLKPNGLILCYPVITSREDFGHQESIHNLLGEDFEEKKKMMALENQVSSQVPQTFLWHTFEDETVPFQNSLLFVDALGKAGIPAEFHLFPQGEHGMSLADESVLRQDGTGIQTESRNWMPLLKIWLKRICSN